MMIHQHVGLGFRVIQSQPFEALIDDIDVQDRTEKEKDYKAERNDMNNFHSFIFFNRGSNLQRFDGIILFWRIVLILTSISILVKHKITLSWAERSNEPSEVYSRRHANLEPTDRIGHSKGPARLVPGRLSSISTPSGAR